MSNFVRTRFAPSPTGFMHIGNLRTALVAYLVAKSANGRFVLRIEDTDRKRFVENAENVIYETLKEAKLIYDEGPDIGGEFGPYKQSERLEIYSKYAEKLIKNGNAYFCFCAKERLDALKISTNDGAEFLNYDRHCLKLSANEIKSNLKNNVPYVIRQKIPHDGRTVFNDLIFGEISVENKEIEDQILIKSDGYPTYNFANVVDDHLMKITHVVRGTEYLSSTPKYDLLYNAFGWQIPEYIHLPLILGKNQDGTTSKLSKRHGAVGFFDLLNEGYLSEAVVNYIALLGWAPLNENEFFSLDELIKNFSIERINKSPSIFDYDKLKWFNAEYIRKKTLENFTETIKAILDKVIKNRYNYKKIAAILQPRITKLSEISELIEFLNVLPSYDKELFINKKSKTNLENSLENLKIIFENLKSADNWSYEFLHNNLINLAKNLKIKNGTLLFPLRVALSGKSITCGGAIEILDILGKEESLNRIKFAIQKILFLNEK